MTREEPRRYIRTNYIKISSDNLRERLSSKGFILETTDLAEVFLIKNNPYPIGATTEYLLGYYYIQDLSSCFTVDALDLSNNMLVLDMASSPGGKTTFIAQRMNNTGCILAVEPNPHRLKRLFYNIERCGVANTSIWNIDGKNILDYGLKFDRVLLDAPVVAMALFKRKRVENNLFKESITHCSLKQNKLLEVAVEVTKPEV
jgi:NOL1/NOP2/sun family putative RNA methylase